MRWAPAPPPSPFVFIDGAFRQSPYRTSFSNENATMFHFSPKERHPSSLHIERRYELLLFRLNGLAAKSEWLQQDGVFETGA